MRSIPFFKIILCFALGILCSTAWDVPNPAIGIALIILLLIGLWFVYRAIQAIVIAFGLFLAGFILASLQNYEGQPLSFKNRYCSGDVLCAWVKEVPTEQKNGFKLELNTSQIIRGDSVYDVEGYTTLWLPRVRFEHCPVKAGDQIITNALFKALESPKNPFEFDYAQFLKQRHYDLSGFLNSDAFFEIQMSKHPYYRAKNIRSSILKTLKQHGFSDQDLGIMMALLIGDKNDIPDEVSQAYTNSGTMHVLAVSGMHVAILYFVLDQLFSKLIFRKKYPFLKHLTLLCALWSYAFLTGFGASILRATFMFSLHIVAKMIGQKSNPLNTVFSSAFLLLVINPILLFDVGFQLSYLAVLGIMIIHPLIFEKLFWCFSNRNLNWINPALQGFWTLISVSLAAQIATCPLSIYYFEQFPNYFLLSNLVVVPLSTVILYGGIFFFAVSGFTPVSEPLVWILKQMIQGMTDFNIWIESLPGSCSQGLYLSAVIVFLAYVSLVFLILFFYHPKHVFVQGLVIGLVGIFGFNIGEKFLARESDQIIILHHPKQHSLGVFQNGRARYYSTAEKPHPSLEKILGRYSKTPLERLSFDDLFYKGYAQFGEVSMFALHTQTLDHIRCLESYPVQYIWVCDTISPYAVFETQKNPSRYWKPMYEDVLKPYYTSSGKTRLDQHTCVILDAGLPTKYHRLWRAFLDGQWGGSYDVLIDGAWGF